ncbi:hypothetical protein [Mycobacterium terramassiliense]|uniref:Mycobacterium terramassiliense ORFan n=1 Tax=Mycobacterium terramassiliense TaxID=1841859 RepID=A0A2U3NGI8_9MYCO|nr:Mycobacterium terramassiliense ORFan [Mycobacterium terramassiliense]
MAASMFGDATMNEPTNETIDRNKPRFISVTSDRPLMPAQVTATSMVPVCVAPTLNNSSTDASSVTLTTPAPVALPEFTRSLRCSGFVDVSGGHLALAGG